ncbi:glycine C-acetyltransferase [Maribacter polysaccharolyticus]|uniref:glycine C-acetyltransferase n=1 Tax=Maribacter polysaccharolyticus TaxID=3020831 RepID=UPI00237FA2B9|nr:glycine C-acetyltransferase [Maribacter polysaccharolyticus]MDE3741021.1 glycine C-acetyltransferase [Maribacter polysaccharolyticus]
MYGSIKKDLQSQIENIKSGGLYKEERIITSKQGPEISTTTSGEALNFCANNYLGLAASPEVIDAGIEAIRTHGFGLSSVRFICGTQDIHKQLEQKTAEFLGMEDCILYAAAFDANGGLFEPLFSSEDAIISDELNHASIIDGIRLCKAKRFRYKHNNMEDLEEQLKQAGSSRRKLIVSDGSFSMDGTIAQLDKICDLADTYDALVMIDECHSTGFIGKTGRGTHEYHDVIDRIDIITGTFGKALGGASGGFTAARKEIIDILRQHSRPYLFSNTLAPAIVGASLKVLDIVSKSTHLRDKLEENTLFFRSKMTEAGFKIVEGTHPIVPIMLGEATIAQEFANRLLEEGIYVIGFFFPVVPKGKARIRVQLSAAHDKTQITKTINAFIKIGKAMKVID